MNRFIAKWIVRIIGTITTIIGLFAICASLKATPEMLRCPHPIIGLLIALFMAAFGVYVVHLGFLLYVHRSRKVFERVYLGAAIFLMMSLRHMITSESLYYLIFIFVGIIAVFARSAISDCLFLKGL
ncbi:MAG: hypothetical protein PHD76_13435 [Methylacidiphilales bacterium]|nr:hypothetical protein [Candidatus Methylacidiphilales bacterium]